VKKAIPLALARRIAEQWTNEHLAPHCERVQIAGSIRRQKPEVGDVEIVAIPRVTTIHDLFGAPVAPEESLTPYLNRLVDENPEWRFAKNGPRYKQIELADVNLDLFLVRPPAQWGVILAIRTGPWEFSKWLVTKRRFGGALPSDCKVEDGAVWRNGKVVPMPEEANLFAFLELDWIEPQSRGEKS